MASVRSSLWTPLGARAHIRPKFPGNYRDPYPAPGPWALLRSSSLPRRARRALSGLDRRLTGAGGCAALIALAAAGPLFVLGWMFAAAAAVPIWLLVLLALTAAHLLSVRRRSRSG